MIQQFNVEKNTERSFYNSVPEDMFQEACFLVKNGNSRNVS
jgi:hypothetical protein